jgi:hypothetical protein
VYFAPEALKPGTMIVLEGRALLKDGDHVAAKVEPAVTASSGAVNAPAGKEETK